MASLLPLVVGIGGSTHDYAYYYTDDVDQHYAIEEERISRSKHGVSGFSAKSRDLLLSLMSGRKPDLIVANDAIVGLDESVVSLSEEFVQIGHHFAHACWAFFSSGFSESVIVIVDGCGSVLEKGVSSHTREVSTIWCGKGANITLLETHGGTRGESHHLNTPTLLTSNSIGDFYTAVSVALGFGDFGAGKVMALAGMGVPKHVNRLSELITPTSHGQLKVDLSDIVKFSSKLFGICGTQLGDLKSMADLAASTQQLFENTMSSLCKRAHQLYPSPNLCLSGGCALNVAFNGKIPSCTPFENTHIVNAPGDSGTAGGAALWGRMLLGHPAKGNFETISLGPPQRQDIHDLAEAHLNLIARSEEALERTADLLIDGEIVAWHVGRSEFGPRALGNRSIVALPKAEGAKRRINGEIKKRAPFQPFGMSILEDATELVFGVKSVSPFMETALPVLSKMREQLSEVTHFDSSVRFQTVCNSNPFFQLLRKLELKGHIPAVLNTSLNGRDEPICETLNQTIRFMNKNQIRFLYLEDRLYGCSGISAKLYSP